MTAILLKKLIGVLITTLTTEKMVGSLAIHLSEWLAGKTSNTLDNKLISEFKKEFEKNYGKLS